MKAIIFSDQQRVNQLTLSHLNGVLPEMNLLRFLQVP